MLLQVMLLSAHAKAVELPRDLPRDLTDALPDAAEELLREFIAAPACKEDMVFFLWGHGYELDYGTELGSFAHLEKLFQMVSAAKDVCCVTNHELFDTENCGIKQK